MESKTFFNPSTGKFNITTEVEQSEILLNQIGHKDLATAIYCEIATKVADKVMEQLAPAIDKALREIQFKET